MECPFSFIHGSARLISLRKSIVIGLVALAAVASFALFAVQGSRVQAQAAKAKPAT